MAPVFGQRLPLEEPQIVQLMSATIIGGALLQWPIGHLSDRLDRRIVLILTSLATATVALIAGYVVIEGQSGLIPYAFLYGGLMFSLYGISVAHTNDQLEQGQALEATRGLLLIYGIGALCGPIVAGLAMEGAGPVGLPAMSAATAGLLALFGLYRMARRSAPPVEDQTGFVPLVRTSPVVLEMFPAADQSGEIASNPPSADR
jgi:MFS family permease